MPKSFFERLTGSIKIRDDSPAKEEPTVIVEKPAKSNDAKVRSGFRFGRKSPVEVASPVVSEDAEQDEEAEERPAPEENIQEKRPVKPVALAEEEPESSRYDVGSLGAEEAEGQLTLDIYDDGAYFVVQTTVAGVRPEDLDISVNSESVTIRGARKRAQEVGDDRFYAKELYWGKFSRSAVFPEEVDGEKADASLKNGLLTIKIPKKSYASTKKIRIRSE